MNDQDKDKGIDIEVEMVLVYDAGYDEMQLAYIAQIAIDLALRDGYISGINNGDDIKVEFHDGPFGNITVSCNEQTAELECVQFIGGAPLVRKRQTTS